MIHFFRSIEIKKIIINNIFDLNKNSSFENIVELGQIARRLKSENNIVSDLKNNDIEENPKDNLVRSKTNNYDLQSEFRKIEIKSDENKEDNFLGSNSKTLKPDWVREIEKFDIKSEENKEDNFFKFKSNTLKPDFIPKDENVMDRKNINLISYSKKLRKEDELNDNFYFKISYCSLMKNACCKHFLSEEEHKKFSQLNYANYYIYKKLDIAYYLKQFIKFDYLLKIILTKEERLLFHYPRKPRLKEFHYDNINKLFNDKNKNELVQFYKKNKQGLNRKSVIDFLNPVVKEYLSKNLGADKNNNK